MTAFADPRAIVDAFAAAVNAKDADAIGEIFTEDAEFVNIAGVRMQGRRRIVAGHAWAFAGPLLGSRVRFDEVDELPVTGDVVVLHGHSIRESLPNAPAGTLPPGTAVLVFVARRDAEGWQAVAATNVNETALPS